MTRVRVLCWSFRIVRSLYCGICHAAEHYQKQCCSYKRASPYPILNHARITFAPHNAHCKLTQGAGVNIQKKETSADRENATGQQKNIASGEKQWIANSSPGPPTHHMLLRCFDKTDNRNEARKHNCHYNCDNERSNLPANRAADLRHAQILLASLASRKSRQLHYRDEKFVLPN